MPRARRAEVRWIETPLFTPLLAREPETSLREAPASGSFDLPALLEEHLGVGLRAVFSEAECAAWTRGVYESRRVWTRDFGGEQFSLGRAFYTHLEQDRTGVYFRGAAASDARVERYLPGMQAWMRALVARVTGGVAVARRGFCGPGVHIFPAGEHVAREGGVVHFDTEGLSDHHRQARRPALTVVVMLSPPTEGGGLRLWDVQYEGRDEASDEEIARPSVVSLYGVGDALVLDSYRLHQIQPFAGERDRVSVTVHAAEIVPGRWETWF